jgi:hypothetical protein
VKNPVDINLPGFLGRWENEKRELLSGPVMATRAKAAW